MSLLLSVIVFICAIIYMLYSWSWTFRICAWRPEVRLKMRVICWELRPFALFAIPVDAWNYIAVTHDGILGRAFILIIYAAYMLMAILDKNDRWKKRRKKLAAKIKEVAGRLVVVPIPVPIPVGA